MLQLLRHWGALLHAPDHEPHGRGPAHPHGGEIAVPRLQAAGQAPCDAVRVKGMEGLIPSRGPEHPRLATSAHVRARQGIAVHAVGAVDDQTCAKPTMGRVSSQLCAWEDCFYSARCRFEVKVGSC